MRPLLLLACLAAPAALAAPRIESLAVKPNPADFAGGKPPEVQITVAIRRGQFDRGGCDVAVDPGDGSKPRRVELGVATSSSVRHVYRKAGTFQVTARGGGAAPCEGTASASVTVKGPPPAEKKPAAKKKAPQKKKGAEAPSSKRTP